MDEAEKFRKRGKVLSESLSKGLSFDAGPLKEKVNFQEFPRGPVGPFGLRLALGLVIDKTDSSKVSLTCWECTRYLLGCPLRHPMAAKDLFLLNQILTPCVE